MITITSKAAEQVLQSIAQQPDAPALSLRVAAKRLADGSFDYAMGLDQPNQHDTCAESNGVRVVVAPTSVEFLRGATLDYVALDGAHQFIFMNPNDPAYVAPAKPSPPSP
ncbi:MAG: HesB/IscA family protein [bacterium]